MELKPGYKLTDLGVIPNDWRTPEVGEVCGFIVPGRNKPKLFDGDIPWITTPDMEEGQTVTSSRLGLHISRAEAKLIGSKIVPPGSVLMSCAGELGIVALTQNEIVVNQQLHVFIPTECIEKKFLLNALAYQKNQIASFGTKTAVPYLNKSSCNSILIPLPPLPEQRSIATALSDMNELLGGLDRLITKKRDLKQSAMQQLLTGKTRLPGFDEEWDMKQLGDVLTICHGRNQREVQVEDGSYPILATGGEIGRARSFLYDKPSVLIGRKGTIDQPKYIDTPFWTVDTLFYSIIHDFNSAKFIFYSCCLIDWYKYNEASGVPSLSARTIEKIDITFPKPKEQIAIASILSDMDTEIATLEQRRNKTRDLKQAMMQELLTGRIRLL